MKNTKITAEDFKKLLDSRFGTSRGSRLTAAKALNMDYSYLSHMVTGVARPSAALLEKLMNLPVIEGYAHKFNTDDINIPKTLSDRITAIQVYFKVKDYPTTLRGIIELGIQGFEERQREIETGAPIPRPTTGAHSNRTTKDTETTKQSPKTSHLNTAASTDAFE